MKENYHSQPHLDRRFYFDTDIDIIQRFQNRNKLLY
ncbi:unnamed protein product [Brassica oleracea]